MCNRHNILKPFIYYHPYVSKMPFKEHLIWKSSAACKDLIKISFTFNINYQDIKDIKCLFNICQEMSQTHSISKRSENTSSR